MKKAILVSAIALTTLLSPISSVFADKVDDVIEDAHRYKGTPYVWAGSTPSGFDCSGYLQYVFNMNGIKIPRTVAEIYKQGEPVAKADLKEGDLVFFETYKPGASHAGIYLGNGNFIHASSSEGVTIDSINNPYYWKQRYIGAKRIIKEEKVEVVATSDTTFRDVPESHWSYNAIEEFAKKGLVNGYIDGTFKPSQSITREQVAVILTAFLGLKSTGGEIPFEDVNEKMWSASPIRAVYEHDIFVGDENGNFRPKEALTRAQLATILSRTYDLKPEANVSTFTDVRNSYWAFPHIQSAYDFGIFGGYQDGTFKPHNDATRAQFVTVLNRLETALEK